MFQSMPWLVIIIKKKPVTIVHKSSFPGVEKATVGSLLGHLLVN